MAVLVICSRSRNFKIGVGVGEWFTGKGSVWKPPMGPWQCPGENWGGGGAQALFKIIIKC